jgi:hypothetical protein
MWVKGERDPLEQIDDLVEWIESISCCEVWRWVALGISEILSGRRNGLAGKKMRELESTHYYQGWVASRRRAFGGSSRTTLEAGCCRWRDFRFLVMLTG